MRGVFYTLWNKFNAANFKCLNFNSNYIIFFSISLFAGKSKLQINSWLCMIYIIIWNRRSKLVELNILSIARYFESKQLFQISMNANRNAAQNEIPQRSESVFKIQIWESDTKYAYEFHASIDSQICDWFFIKTPYSYLLEQPICGLIRSKGSSNGVPPLGAPHRGISLQKCQEITFLRGTKEPNGWLKQIFQAE